MMYLLLFVTHILITQPVCPSSFLICSPVSNDHTLTLLSCEHEIIYLLSFVTRTQSVCPSSFLICSPKFLVSSDHTRTLLSYEPDMMYLLSLIIHTLVTQL